MAMLDIRTALPVKAAKILGVGIILAHYVAARDGNAHPD
jgi:hypothetical protein